MCIDFITSQYSRTFAETKRGTASTHHSRATSTVVRPRNVKKPLLEPAEIGRTLQAEDATSDFQCDSASSARDSRLSRRPTESDRELLRRLDAGSGGGAESNSSAPSAPSSVSASSTSKG